jgi:putative ABC transport system permease protein
VFRDQLEQRIAALPGVAAVGGASMIPLSGNNQDVGLRIEGRPAPATREDAVVADYRSATPGYFAAIGMRLLRGRGITAADGPGAPLVAVINETMARRYWPNEDAIGKRLTPGGSGGDAIGADIPWTTVVGIVADVHHFGLDQPARPEMYLPYAQSPARAYTVVVRTRSDPAALAPMVRNAIRALDADLPTPTPTLLSSMVTQSVALPRLFVAFFGFFAAIAVLLAGVGIYGVTAHAVSQRRQEIGVRMALGAEVNQVVGMVVQQALVVIGAGLGIGLVAALLFARALSRLLFELSPHDPLTFASIAALLAAVALLASWAPARRAATVDPVKALRTE